MVEVYSAPLVHLDGVVIAVMVRVVASIELVTLQVVTLVSASNFDFVVAKGITSIREILMDTVDDLVVPEKRTL